MAAVGKDGSSTDVSNLRWLLLAHQLPTTRSNARVKTWRRLQQLGAVPARSSVYVLPNTDQSREDFEWLRTEIVALGGEATVFAADAKAAARRGNRGCVSEPRRKTIAAEDVRRLLSSTARKRRSGEQRPRLSRAVRRCAIDSTRSADRLLGAAARDRSGGGARGTGAAVDDPAGAHDIVCRRRAPISLAGAGDRRRRASTACRRLWRSAATSIPRRRSFSSTRRSTPTWRSTCRRQLVPRRPVHLRSAARGICDR